eukprot:scaffold57_cov33-Tisochrysis_lutea.AAC.2
MGKGRANMLPVDSAGRRMDKHKELELATGRLAGPGGENQNSSPRVSLAPPHKPDRDSTSAPHSGRTDGQTRLIARGPPPRPSHLPDLSPRNH